MNHVHDLLVRARTRIATPDRIARNVLARNASGDEVSISAPDAVCWCMYAALSVEAADTSIYSAAVLILQRHVPDGFIALFSDTAPHRQILAAFDAAIEEARNVKPRGTR